MTKYTYEEIKKIYLEAEEAFYREHTDIYDFGSEKVDAFESFCDEEGLCDEEEVIEYHKDMTRDEICTSVKEFIKCSLKDAVYERIEELYLKAGEAFYREHTDMYDLDSAEVDAFISQLNVFNYDGDPIDDHRGMTSDEIYDSAEEFLKYSMGDCILERIESDFNLSEDDRF